MGSAFTNEEKRFLLAEVIKTSTMDIESLSNFIRANGIEPNWMQMQLPLGRNMNQCMHAADQIGLSRRMKRKATDDQGESGAKRMSLLGTLDSFSVAAAAPAHIPILPRPTSSPTDTPTPGPAAVMPPSTAPKKKGRPARADRAKLKANLPQAIAPRPVEQNQNSLLNTQSNDQAKNQQNTKQDNQLSSQPQANERPQGASTLRPLLPANAHGYGNYSNHGASYATSAVGGTNLQGPGMPQDEMAHPRVMAEPSHEHFGSPRPPGLPGLVPLEPEPRASNPDVGDSNNELTTLPPMLDGNAAFMSSPRVDTQPSVANST